MTGTEEYVREMYQGEDKPRRANVAFTGGRHTPITLTLDGRRVEISPLQAYRLYDELHEIMRGYRLKNDPET